MITKQDSKCSICGKTFKNFTACHIDHNHKSRQIRGLLCYNCNVGLGILGEDISILRRAINYLKVNIKGE